MTAYVSLLFETICATLQGVAEKTLHDDSLWLLMLRIIQKSLQYDEGGMCYLTSRSKPTKSSLGFWREDKLRQIGPIVVAQLPACIRFNSLESKQLLNESITALIELAAADIVVKNINREILMYTRSDDTLVRIFALNCSEHQWREHGGKLLGMLAQFQTEKRLTECKVALSRQQLSSVKA